MCIRDRAYSAGSLYIKNKNSIVIRSGIEQKNYEKALEIIEKQIDDMKQGNFDETDMKNAKQLIVASFRSMEDEQDSTISYYFGKEMEQENADIATYISQIENVTKEQINAAMKAASNESFGYNEDEIVSSDIVGMRFGSLFDATQTMVLPLENGTTEVQVVSWYDNENSYTSQMVRTIKYFAELA